MKFTRLRSPHHLTAGIVYFARMLDKIRLHAADELPAEFRENLGLGFDETCCKFLHVDYPAVVARTKEGGSDEEIAAWVFERGRHPTAEEIKVWNAFMSKRGWRDEASERLIQRKAEGGFSDRADIETMFDYIDADEGRDPLERPQS